MRNTLLSIAIHILANGLGLLLASLLLPGFRIGLTALVFATLIFSLVESLLRPIILKLSQKRVPAIAGGIALITTFAGLFITATLLDNMEMGGISNWLAATLLVWLGALIAGVALPGILSDKKDAS